MSAWSWFPPDASSLPGSGRGCCPIGGHRDGAHAGVHTLCESRVCRQTSHGCRLGLGFRQMRLLYRDRDAAAARSEAIATVLTPVCILCVRAASVAKPAMDVGLVLVSARCVFSTGIGTRLL